MSKSAHLKWLTESKNKSFSVNFRRAFQNSVGPDCLLKNSAIFSCFTLPLNKELLFISMTKLLDSDWLRGYNYFVNSIAINN